MEVLNFTNMLAGCTSGMRPDARLLAVIVVKGTFQIPSPGMPAKLAVEQMPLVEADIFTGEPGLSAALYETDFAPTKPRCDVLLNGSAYSPGGKPAQKVPVAIQVGTMAKAFHVVGDRVWVRGLTSLTPSEPEFLVRMGFTYDNAFGGTDASDPEKPRYFRANHVGRGFHHHLDLDKIVGQPLPNTEEIDNPVGNPRGSYRPMALGPVGRAWEPRAGLAGTYDKKWQEEIFPFLPPDFKDDYYQAAPSDQQIPHLNGGEEVVLHNLTPAGRCDFRIPQIEVPMTLRLVDDDAEEPKALNPVIDTIIIEPDLGRFAMVWRASYPLQQDLFEIDHIVVGEPTPAQRYAYAAGKPYYRSLSDLAARSDEDGE